MDFDRMKLQHLFSFNEANTFHEIQAGRVLDDVGGYQLVRLLQMAVLHLIRVPRNVPHQP